MVQPSWQKNLYAIVVAEFIVLTGFSFVNPFMPLFIQDLGRFTDREAAFWAGIASGASGIAMFFSAPLWGMVADRWGRKPMVLRAMFGGALVTALTGIAPNIPVLIALRFAHGVLSGTIAAASALVAGVTPRNKMPFAMGLITLAMFSGQTFGPLLGGVLADSIGYQASFFVTGSILLSGGLVVLFLVREKFERPQQRQGTSLGSLLRLAMSRDILPLLLVLGTLHLGPQLISPILPLYIREQNPQVEAAATAGLAFSLMGVVAAVSGLVAGRLGQHVNLKRMLMFSCIGTGLLYLPPIWSGTTAQLVIFMATTGLLKGGLMVSSNALIGLSVPMSQQGVAFGMAQSANSLGGGLGPILGGTLTRAMGFKPVFGVAGGLFILVGALSIKLLAGRRRAEEPTREISPQ
ncbi:MAG: MFS transporter [Chloroflexota bacterium]